MAAGACRRTRPHLRVRRASWFSAPREPGPGPAGVLCAIAGFC